MPDSSGSPEHVRIGPASRPTGGTKWTCPHTTSPKAEPPKGALGPRAGRRRLGPRTPPSVPRRAAPDRHLESPKPPPRPSNTPFRSPGPPLDSISPPRRPPHHAPKQGAPLAVPGKLSRLTGEGPPSLLREPGAHRGRSPLLKRPDLLVATTEPSKRGERVAHRGRSPLPSPLTGEGTRLPKTEGPPCRRPHDGLSNT